MRYVPGKSSPCSATHNGQICALVLRARLARNAQNADDLAVAAAAVTALRERSLRSGGYLSAALLLALATYLDVRWAARDSTDRWLVDTRRLLQEAATRIPPPRTRVAISDLAALVPDGEVVAGEPAESAPRRVRVDGLERAVVSPLIGSGRWIEVRSVPAELEAPRWLILLLPCALLGPMAILLVRWAERTPARLRETAIAWGFLGPAALHVTIFTIGPALYAIYLGSTANVRALLRDPLTWNSFVTTGAYALYVPISVALALGAALAVHRYKRKGSSLYRAAFLLPYVSSVVAVALLWQAIYRAGSLGLGRADWLSNPNTALLALMLVSIWVHVGGQMLVFLAGLDAIPQAYFDAALVDGAGAWSRFRRVTLPLLRPVTWFVVLTGVISALQMFTLVFVLTQGGPSPLHTTDVVVHRMYRTAFGPQAFGMASALALMLAVVLLVFRWPQLARLRRQAQHA